MLRPVQAVATLALLASCYRQEPDVYSTLPTPVEVEGAPSGEFDADWQAGYSNDNPQGSITASVDASTDPGFAMAATSDTEIDATLAGYGEWIWIDDYGWVWRPYTTVVGVDFTPYETCGSWVWTDWGWTYACEWDWGWLPFHYGRWGWFEDYWAWQPGYEWSPACVEWRGGGSYVGWRPQAPIVRDHRNKHDGPTVRDHRGDGPIVRDHRKAKTKDWQWRFTAVKDFGKPRIRAHLFKSPAEGLRVTKLVDRPAFQASVQPVKAESIMKPRMLAAWRTGIPEQRVDHRPRGRGELGVIGGGGGGAVSDRPQRPRASADSPSVYQPTYQAPVQPRGNYGAVTDTRGAPEQTYGGLPVQPTTPTPEPDRPSRAPIVTQPAQPSFDTPTPHRPRGPSTTPSEPTRPSYQPPVAHPPRGPTYTAPQPPTRAPDRYNPPPRPSAPPPSYSPPSRSSSSSYSPPSRPSAPPPSYSPPSRSSSSSSSSSYSPPSRSSSSSSSSPSRSSSSSSSGGWSSGSRSHRR